MNELYGKEFILKLKSSGYKSAIYAMAEIIDNSVDANAKNIEIILIEKYKQVGQQRRRYIDEVVFIDDGDGMDENKLNGCLTFSTGDGRNDKRIGAFGVGLPNSSLFVGDRVEVYSRGKNEWKYVYLDVNEQLALQKPGYYPASEKVPKLYETSVINPKTVVKWKDLDNIGASRASTLIERCEVLLGRLYRYKLSELNISFRTYSQDDTTTSLSKKVIPFDPLFLTESENFITKYVWESATMPKYNSTTLELAEKKEFNSSYHYKKHIEGCDPKMIKPIFQKFEPYFNFEDSIELNGKEYFWTIKSAFAQRTITNPGLKSGGGTHLGKQLRVKMNGNAQIRGGNIYFVRANREIDCGSFGLYNVTNEKERFWTIEIHFNSDLDKLMGISNTKQSVTFRAIGKNDLDEIPEFVNLNLTQQREYLWQKLTNQILSSISSMKKEINSYYKEFKETLLVALAGDIGIIGPIQPINPPNVFPGQSKWTDKEVKETTKMLKEKMMQLSELDIKKQVQKFADNQTKTIVLYTPNGTNNLFEIKPKIGKLITLINTEHRFYINVLQPLKEARFLNPFATPIEMFISSMALKMNELINQDKERYEDILIEYIDLVGVSLSALLSKGKIELKLDEIEERFKEAFGEFNL